MEINQKFIQVYGKIGTGETFEMGQERLLNCTVVSIQDKDNFDGSIDRTYKFKLYSE